MADKANCWEVKKCGRQPGGDKVGELGLCAAARETSAEGLNCGHAGGRICWAITGTLCGGAVQGTFAEKRVTCLSCEFFLQVKKEEGRAFKLDVPAPVLP